MNMLRDMLQPTRRNMLRSMFASTSTLTRFAVNGVEAALALDFIGGEYRTANTSTTFADAFTGTSPKLTYSTAAGSNSTMVNSSGEIVWAPHNLVDYSEDFDNAAWSKLGAATIDSTLVTGPDGTLSGRRVLNFDAGGGLLEVVTIANSTLTGGLWVKGEGDNIGKDVRLEVKRYGGTFVGTDVSHTLTADWERIHATFTQLPDNTGVTVVLGNPSTNSASEVLVYGAHVYRSDLGGMHPAPGAVGDFQYYVPTSGSAEYLPRVGHHVYNGTAWVNEGLLIESEPRTNLITESTPQSGDLVLSGGSFSYVTCNFTPLSGPGIHFDTTGVTSYTYFTPTHTADIYTVSVFVEMDDGNAPTFGSSTGSDASNDFALVLDHALVNPLYYAVEHFGGNTYRVSGQRQSVSTTTRNTGVIKYSGNSSRTFKVTGFQTEAGSTPSSYMPTSGGTYTRTAQSLTVPPAEFGWPEPEYIGPELVDNGDFSLGDNGDWTKFNASITTEGVLDGSGGLSMLYQDAVTNGRLYHVSFDATVSAGEIEVINNDGTELFSATTSASHSFVFKHAIANGNLLWRCRSGSNAATIDNISVREINPLSVSIQMDGRMTYADEDTERQVKFVHWPNTSDPVPYIRAILHTLGSYTGGLNVKQYDGTALTSEIEPVSGSYSPGINVPFNIASRHGSTFINGAVDGVALTEDTTPVALPDLSSTNLQIAYDFMGTIGQFRQFAGDIGDTGLVTATNPSTEPTLSLTFDGSEGSFYNLNWSE